jgi:TATA-box binding protein (TBP) (component of TFIID and TFIIIB)
MQAFKNDACVKGAAQDIREIKATEVVSRHQLMIQNSIEAIPLSISENLTEITLSMDLSSMYYLPSLKLRRDKTDVRPLSLD